MTCLQAGYRLTRGAVLFNLGRSFEVLYDLSRYEIGASSARLLALHLLMLTVPPLPPSSRRHLLIQSFRLR